MAFCLRVGGHRRHRGERWSPGPGLPRTREGPVPRGSGDSALRVVLAAPLGSPARCQRSSSASHCDPWPRGVLSPVPECQVFGSRKGAVEGVSLVLLVQSCTWQGVRRVCSLGLPRAARPAELAFGSPCISLSSDRTSVSPLGDGVGVLIPTPATSPEQARWWM